MKARLGTMVAAIAAAASAVGAAAWARRKRSEDDEVDLEVSPAKAPPPAAEAVASTAVAGRATVEAVMADAGVADAGVAGAGVADAGVADAGVADADSPDDLTTLKGLGALSAERLADLGVTRLVQIAAWSDADIDRIAPQIHLAADRIRRDDWVGQARVATEGSTTALDLQWMQHLDQLAGGLVDSLQQLQRRDGPGHWVQGIGKGGRLLVEILRLLQGQPGQTDAAGHRCSGGVGAGDRSSRDRPWSVALAVPCQEGHHVLEAEAAVAPLADTIEGQLTTVPESLDRVDVQVEKLSDLARGEHRSELVDCHGRHLRSLLRVQWAAGRVLGCSGARRHWSAEGTPIDEVTCDAVYRGVGSHGGVRTAPQQPVLGSGPRVPRDCCPTAPHRSEPLGSARGDRFRAVQISIAEIRAEPEHGDADDGRDHEDGLQA